MTGDPQDFVARLRSALPTRWFPDATPVLDAVLSGLATTWAALYALVAQVRLQSRLGTATGSVLDAISGDFFAARLRRGPAEPDASFRNRIGAALVREHATRSALGTALGALTGTAPVIFEPARAADTGAYAGPGLGYGAAGGWGNLSLPFQVFVSVRRPPEAGIATIAGYGTAGPIARGSLAQAGAQATDASILATITAILPTASTAWTRISS